MTTPRRTPRRTRPPADRGEPMVHLDDVVRVFGRGDGQVRALDGVTLSMARGTFTAIMGPSGSGKSTLLQLAAGLDRPTQGTRPPRRAASSTGSASGRSPACAASGSASSSSPSTCSAR